MVYFLLCTVHYESTAFVLWIQSLTEQINMVSCRVEEVSRSCDSDVDSSEEDGTTEKYTLAVWPVSGSPTYLLLSSRQTKVMFL